MKSPTKSEDVNLVSVTDLKGFVKKLLKVSKKESDNQISAIQAANAIGRKRKKRA